MPLVRLTIIFFRGIGWIFRSVGRLFGFLFGPGMFAFLVKSFEVILRLGFVGSIVAATVVCWNLYEARPFVSDGRARLGMPCAYHLDTYNSYSSEKASLEVILTKFAPKNPNLAYGPGKLDAEALIQLWNSNEMVHVSAQPVTWQYNGREAVLPGPKPMLNPEDFAPSYWRELVVFFEASWAVLTLPLVVAWLVFPSGLRLWDRIFRACVWAPACAVASFSFAYLLSRQWLSVQHGAYAELILDPPRWAQPAGLLSTSLLCGFSLSLVPIASWYLLRWVLGPFLRSGVAASSP